MTIDRRPNQGGGERLIMTACPCGYVFDCGEERHRHFLGDHRPEDFGLSPLGEHLPPQPDTPAVATDGGHRSEPADDDRGSHASVVADILRGAEDEDLEAAGIDPDDYRDEDGDRDE